MMRAAISEVEPCRAVLAVDRRISRLQELLSMGQTTGRREWLSMVARGATAATVGVGGRPRVARSDDGGGHPRIKHIVVLMMENRSFDHMFGLLMNEIPGLRGVSVGEWTNVDDQGNVHALTDRSEEHTSELQ